MKVKISLIMPVYNTEKYVGKCIESVINQEFREFELIIVNDGSTDKSGYICNKYSKKDSRIKIFHTKNNGQSTARNIGINNAIGEYIGFVDSDDFIDSNMYKELYAKCIEENSDIGIIGLREVDEDNLILNEYIPQDINLVEIMKRAYPCNKLIKRKLFLDNDLMFKEGRYYEDVDLISKLFLKSKKISVVKKVTYNYFVRKGSTTKNRDEKILDNLWAYTSIKDYLISEDLYEKYGNEFEECIKNFKKYYFNELYDYSTQFLFKNRKRIIDDFNSIGGISLIEIYKFMKKHIIFTLKKHVYNVKAYLKMRYT